MDCKLQLDVTINFYNRLKHPTYKMSGHIVWSCFASQRDPEPYRLARSLRSRGYITNKKLIRWLSFGRGGMYKREDIIIVPIQTFPLSILAFSPLPPRHQVTSRDNHRWRHSLAYVVDDGVWYTLRGKNFYYRNVGGNAPPPTKMFVFWGVLSPPPPVLAPMYHEGKCWRMKAPNFFFFKEEVKTIIYLGNSSAKLHLWKKLLLEILLLSRLNRKCLSCWVNFFFLIKKN